LTFHSNYDPILYRFPDKAKLWSTITIFVALSYARQRVRLSVGLSVHDRL